VVTRIENAIKHKDIALGAFLDTQEAFERTSFDITQSAERHGTEPALCKWICAMLVSRNISATLSEETLGASAAGGGVSAGRNAFHSAVEPGRG
jgi:hypothetical protein